MVNSTVRLDAGSLQVHAAGYEANLTALYPLRDPERVERALAAPALPISAADSRRRPGVAGNAAPRFAFGRRSARPRILRRQRIVAGAYLDATAGVVLGGPGREPRRRGGRRGDPHGAGFWPAGDRALPCAASPDRARFLRPQSRLCRSLSPRPSPGGRGGDRNRRARLFGTEGDCRPPQRAAI
jgi:hypothetical protein